VVVVEVLEEVELEVLDEVDDVLELVELDVDEVVSNLASPPQAIPPKFPVG